MFSIKKIYLLILLFGKGHANNNDSITLDTCTSNLPIPVLGTPNTEKYSYLFFGENRSSVSFKQQKCILDGDNQVSQIIKECSQDLTINSETIPFKVAQGMALNSESNWVSACAPEMPCITINEYLANGTVGDLMISCGAEKQWELVKKNNIFLKSSYLGLTQCQKYQPSLCIQSEKNNYNNTVMYACPVSPHIYTANFMLLYILNPHLAASLPGCRLRYYDLNKSYSI